MRGSRMLLIVGAVLVIGAIVVGVVVMLGGGDDSEPVAEDGTVVPEIPTVQIVVAAQNLDRGVHLTEEMFGGEAPAVILQDVPEEDVPVGALTSLDAVYGRTTRVDIMRDQPILMDMLVTEGSGGGAALQVPEGMVAYALPVERYSGVAWALQSGDYVDMIISLLFVDLDEEQQVTLPLRANCVSPPEGEECTSSLMGRLEVLPNGWLVNLSSNGSQRAQLVTQLTVQNVRVLRVGDWVASEAIVTAPEDAAQEDAEAPAEEQVPLETPVQAALTLAVSRQDAMVLEYAQLTGARITFLLRRTGDENRVSTEAITLDYLMTRFNIELPPKLPYGVEPQILSLEIIDQQILDEEAE